MYQSVEEFFTREHPDLVGALTRSGAFWPRIAGNTFSNAELETEMVTSRTTGGTGGQTYRAAYALLEGRRVGKIKDPG